MKARLAVIGAAVGLLSLPVLALAHKQEVTDPRDGGTVDIRRVVVTHSAKKITFTIYARKKIPKGSEPCIDIKSSGPGFIAVGCYQRRQMNPPMKRIGYDRGGKWVQYKVALKNLPYDNAVPWRAVYGEEGRTIDAAPNKGYAKHKL